MTHEPGFVPWPESYAARYRELGAWTGVTFGQLLDQLAERHGEHIALVDARERLSYAQLADQARRMAAGLRQLGIGRGDAVVVQLPNRVELVVLYFALFALGARPVMAQLPHRRLELTQFIQRSRAVAHACPDMHARFDYRALSRELKQACPTLRHTLVLGDAQELCSLSALRASEPAPLPPGPKASDIALFQLSGGSTDVPKLIARTHDDYLYSVRRSAELCQLTQHSVYLALLPAAHNFPLSSPGVLGALSAGGRVVLCEEAGPDAALDWIAREQVTITALVPALLPPLLACAARRRAPLSSLRVLQVGGAKLHQALARRVPEELGCTLQQVFGMAEGLVCYTRLDAPLDVTVSTQGLPVSSLDELRVLDEQGRSVPDGEVGELYTRGPYTIRGYYDAAEHNARSFTSDGFYGTGDLVRRCSDGSLVVEGRSKDQINRAGEKIAAPEVEAQLLSHPKVEAAALVAVSDAYLGERSHAFVVTSGPVTSSELRAYLRERGLAAYKIPDRIELTSALPKTPVGKIDKRALRARAESPSQAAPSAHAREPQENA